MSIGTRIKQARKSTGMTQEELASKIGSTKGAIANYENEVSVPKLELLLNLMNILQVDANFLYQDEMIKTKISSETVSLTGSEDIKEDIANKLTELLTSLGMMSEDGTVTAEDEAFLMGILSIAQAYFSKRGKDAK